VNSQLCSRNQLEIIWALWHGVLSCWKWPSEDWYCGPKGVDMVSNNTQAGCDINDAQLVLRGQKCAKKTSPHTIIPPPPAWTNDKRQDGSMHHVVYPKFGSYHLNAAAEIKTHQTIHFSNPLLSNFGEPVPIIASVSCSTADRSVTCCVFCCCSPSASRFNMFCVQRCFSVDIGCKDYTSYCCLSIIWPLSSGINKAFSLRTAAHWIFFFWPFSVNPRNGFV